jgi:hypothetical protein
VSANNACQDGADILSCLHLIEVETNGYQVVQDIVAGRSGYYAYYPALSIDSQGNLIVGFTESGASEYPSAAAASRAPNDALNTLSHFEILKAGQTSYSGQRWGDYSGAAVDPSSGSVWVGAEYAKTTGGIISNSGHVPNRPGSE